MQVVHSGYCQAAGLCGDTAPRRRPGAWGLPGQARVSQGTTLFSARNATCLFPAHLYLLGCRDYVKERGGVPLQRCLQMVYGNGSGHELVVLRNQAVQYGEGAVLLLKVDRLPWVLPAVSPPVCSCLHPPCLHRPVLPPLHGAHGALRLLQHSLAAARFTACLVHCRQRPALLCTLAARILHCPLPAPRTACAAPCTTSSTSQPAALCPVLPVPCATCSTVQRLHSASPGAPHAARGAVRCCSTAHCSQHHAPPFAPCTACSDMDHLQHCAALVLRTTCILHPLRPALCTLGSSAPPALCTARSVTHGLHPVLPAASCTAHGRLHHLQGRACHALCAACSTTRRLQHPLQCVPLILCTACGAMDCLYCALRALSIACSPVLQLCRAAPAAPGTTLLYHVSAGTVLAVNHSAAHALPAPRTALCLSPCAPGAACSTGMALLRVPPCLRCLHRHCLHQALPAALCSTLHRVLPAPSVACSGVLSSATCPLFPCHALPRSTFSVPLLQGSCRLQWGCSMSLCAAQHCSPNLGAQPSCAAGDVLQGAGIPGRRGILARARAARKTPSLHLGLKIVLYTLGVKGSTFFLKSWYLSENTGYQPSCALCWHRWPGWVLLKHC